MFSAIGDLLGLIATPIHYAISAILLGWHWLFSLVLDESSGWNWMLSIIGLTVTIRALLIPLFVKQIKSSRNMQLIQPKVRELQKKYGHDRERLAQETMKLYKDHNTNPFSSCLPLLLQMPIFLTLFHMLRSATNGEPKGFLTKGDVESLNAAHIFSVPLTGSFSDPSAAVKVTALVLVVLMVATQFVTQRQLMSKNMPADAMSGPFAQQQKLLLYVLPVVFAVGSFLFPIALMIYWTASNLWTMGQQFYVIRNNPVPGSPAEKAKLARDAAKAAKNGLTPAGDVIGEVVDEAPEAPKQQRQQPKKQSRSKRKR